MKLQPVRGREAAHRQLIVDFAAKSRLPAVYPLREFVDVGGLMSYGASVTDSPRRAAIYVDKILNGAKARRPSRGATDEA